MSGVSVTIAPPGRPGLRPARPMGWAGPRGYVPRRPAVRGTYPRWAVAGAGIALALAGTGAVATVAAAPAIVHPAPKPPSVACAPRSQVASLTGEQRANATTIIAVGRAMGVPERGQVVALATAMQESTLHNYDGGDRDSAGLFQQRPSMGWGSLAQVTTPTYSARTFYSRLMKLPGWERMALTDAAQKIQRSAFPNAYAKWEALARALVAGTTCGRTA